MILRLTITISTNHIIMIKRRPGLLSTNGKRQFQQYFTDGQSSVIHEEKNSCNQNAIDDQFVSLLDKE